jgi:hypothetical protein
VNEPRACPALEPRDHGVSERAEGGFRGERLLTASSGQGEAKAVKHMEDLLSAEKVRRVKVRNVL